MRVLLDTSFLITLVNTKRKNHQIAKSYYRHMIQHNIQMCVSAIAISEYAVKDSIATLPAGNLIILPFNALDGIESARLYNEIFRDDGDNRQAVKDDVKLMGHGAREKIPFMLTDDKNTLWKYCNRLVTKGIITLKTIALVDGFDDCAFDDDAQIGLGLGTP